MSGKICWDSGSKLAIFKWNSFDQNVTMPASNQCCKRWGCSSIQKRQNGDFNGRIFKIEWFQIFGLKPKNIFGFGDFLEPGEKIFSNVFFGPCLAEFAEWIWILKWCQDVGIIFKILIILITTILSTALQIKHLEMSWVP